MDYYDVDGNLVECNPIYGEGREGQIVVLDSVSFKESNSPLAEYAQPAFFHVVSQTDDYCMLRDLEGCTVELKGADLGSVVYLYDLKEWASWTTGKAANKLRQRNIQIGNLLLKLDLLKDILIRQGTKIVTESEAKKLGLSN